MIWPTEDIGYHSFSGGEDETLQTDIYRFMSIIGFCLMAVLALVQAIPVTGPQPETVIENVSDQVDRQKGLLKNLMNENDRLTKDVTRLVQLENLAGSRQDALVQADKELKRQKKRIAQLAAEKIDRQNNMLQYKHLLQKRNEQIKDLEAAKTRVEKIVAPTKAETKDHGTRKTEPAKESTGRTSAKGLYVAFASDRVFLDLLGMKTIHLFISVKGVDRGFKVIKDNRGIVFQPGSPDHDLDLWEVKANMIPKEILAAFKAWSTLADREKLMIVGLPLKISKKIRSKQVASGRFIIHEGGRVSHSD